MYGCSRNLYLSYSRLQNWYALPIQMKFHSASYVFSRLNSEQKHQFKRYIFPTYKNPTSTIQSKQLPLNPYNFDTVYKYYLKNRDNLHIKWLLEFLNQMFIISYLPKNYLIFQNEIFSKPDPKFIDVIVNCCNLILDTPIFLRGCSKESMGSILSSLCDLQVTGLSKAFYNALVEQKEAYMGGYDESHINAMLQLSALDDDFSTVNKLMEIVQNEEMNLFANTYFTILKILGQNGRIEMIHQFYLFASNFQPQLLDETFYASLVDAYVTANRLDLAELMEKEMKRKQIQIPLPKYMESDIFYDQLTEVDKVLNFYHSISNSSLVTGINDGNNIFNQPIEPNPSQDIDSAKKMINDLFNSRDKPQTQDFNRLIEAYLNSGCISEAREVARLMVTMSRLPTPESFTLFIRFYCIKKNIDRAKSAFEEMSTFGMVPNLQCYTYLILLHCKLNQAKEAFDLLRQAHQMGVRLSCPLFYSMIKSFTSNGDNKNALKAFRLMRAYHVPIAPGFLLRFLKKCFELKATKIAKNIYLTIPKTKLLCHPNLNKSIFYGHCYFGNIQDILAYFDSWEISHSKPLSVHALNRALEILFVREDVEACLKMLNYSIKTSEKLAKCYPNSETLFIGMEGFANRGRYDLTKWTFERLQKPPVGLEPTSIHLNLMIRVYYELKEFQNMETTFEWIIQSSEFKLEPLSASIYISMLASTQPLEQFKTQVESIFSHISPNIANHPRVMNTYLFQLIEFEDYYQGIEFIRTKILPNQTKLSDKTIRYFITKLTQNYQLQYLLKLKQILQGRDDVLDYNLDKQFNQFKIN